MSIYLGLDYGTKHIGVALADGPLAHPLTTISGADDTLPQIVRLVAQHQATSIVMGLPEGKLARQVQAFASRLKDATGLPVILHPETLSTVEAISGLRAARAKRKKLQNDHLYAACLILEDYLEQSK